MNKPADTLYTKCPLGWLRISGDKAAVHAISFEEEEGSESPDPPAALLQCREELNEYFQGKRKVFTVPWVTDGTVFQQSVWKTLADIPFGRTMSYGHLARQLGNEDAVRAVGMANGQNPLAIIIPCHRVVGANGKLTGYAGGLWRKKWLLEHEQIGAQGDLFT
ncbi:MAG: methylated-DNA--[protein]-cysteine S-methyltransferase [Saprospiraceae bacterium]|nr:methylated-DNA--[protein]-cysteine S-methyltransferase [Saprospiraceae bacterium]